MASTIFLVQQILTGLGTSMNNPQNISSTAGSSNGTQSASGAGPMPTDLSSLITMLFSISALGDWVKLIVIGGFFETCRRVAFSAYHSFVNSFFITVRFHKDDSSYDWMMVWLSKQPSWSNARNVSISTRSFGLNSTAILIPGEEDEGDADMSTLTNRSTRKLAYLPAISTSYSMWYKRRWMRVTRVQEEGAYGQKDETLEIKVMTRTHKYLNDILLEAKREYLAAQEHTISIYVADSGNYWRHIATRPKRSMRSIVLDPGIKDVLVDDARDFLESKKWYADRGIPHRRGYLLYGMPGSGKTSMIHSMAGELGLDVYVVSLSRIGLDDTSLNELISELPERCIALMEDIDAAFSNNLTKRDLPDESSKDEEDKEEKQSKPAGPDISSSRITLSGLLNALDGVSAQEGRILYATTNNYSALDPALCRPGRMDIHVEFRLASKFQAQELFRCFYVPEGSVLSEVDAVDPADSGYNSASAEKSEFDLINLETNSSASSELFDEKSKSTVPVVLDPGVFSGASHRGRAPKLSARQAISLASQFADAIPERQVSMASLQGYLMMYKTRPFEAVRQAAAWVETEEAERAERKGKDKTVEKVEKVEDADKGDSTTTSSSNETSAEGTGKTDTKDSKTQEIKITLSIVAAPVSSAATSTDSATVTFRTHIDADTSTSNADTSTSDTDTSTSDGLT